MDFNKEVEYWWTVTSAPEGSVYVPECSPEEPCLEETVEVEESVTTHKLGNGTENEIITYTTTTTVLVSFCVFSLLTPGVPNEMHMPDGRCLNLTILFSYFGQYGTNPPYLYVGGGVREG